LFVEKRESMSGIVIPSRVKKAGRDQVRGRPDYRSKKKSWNASHKQNRWRERAGFF